MAFIDFADLKARISIHQVASQMLGLKLVQKGDQYRGACPLHNGTNPREFVITASKNLWHCFGGCGGGDQLALVARLKGISKDKMHEAARLIADHFGATPTQAAPKTTPVASQKPRREGFDPDKYAQSLDPAHEALKGLSVAAETLRAFGAGYSSSGVNKGRLALRLNDRQGNFVCYTGRAVSEEQTPTLTFPNGVKPEEHIFNADRVGAGDLYLVRDPIGVLKAYESGIENVVAFMTEGISAQQLEQLASLMDEKKIESVELF